MSKVAYKLRKQGTDKNDWFIAVIYQYEQWRPSSLQGKGLINPDFIRDATPDEEREFAYFNRLRFFTYSDFDIFLNDENKYWQPSLEFTKIIDAYKR